MKKEETVVRHSHVDGEPYLELRGVHVYMYINGEDEVSVQITTPEDSDIWKSLYVYMNDGEAVAWK